MASEDIDPVWENDIYSKGLHLSRYPYDSVVSFVFRNYPRDRPRQQVRIVEIGCGAANNLWFAAREGFQVAGIDGSASAIESAKARFESEGLHGDLRSGSFTQLPWEADSFDLAIERGAIVCVNYENQCRAVEEVRRVLRPGGVFCLNTYSDRSTSAHGGRKKADGMVADITEGTLTGVGSLRFLSRAELEQMLSDGWEILSLVHLDCDDVTAAKVVRHSEWRVVVRKK
jgi:2-polyprenyl-3-methyl-5-hydroxy-6-metoxy-1,4-benzoquinol methylase